MFGVAGGALAGLALGLRKGRRIDDHRATTQAAAAQAIRIADLVNAVPRAEVLPLAELAEVRVEKKRLKARRLVLRTDSGEERRYSYTEPNHSTAWLADLFGDFVGERFTGPV